MDEIAQLLVAKGGEAYSGRGEYGLMGTLMSAMNRMDESLNELLRFEGLQIRNIDSDSDSSS